LQRQYSVHSSLGHGVITLSLLAIALAGTGLLTTVGVIVAMDTFGPISDNAQGIAEMSGDVKGEGAQILTSLDAVGNTTKAITKGIAIATAVLAATALFGAFTDAIKEAVLEAGKNASDLARDNSKAYLNVARPTQPRRSDHRRSSCIYVLRSCNQCSFSRSWCSCIRSTSPVRKAPWHHEWHREA
jgi:hypothetical protein